MKFKSITTKQGQDVCKRWQYSIKYNLTQCYKNPSDAKQGAYDICAAFMKKHFGNSMRIIGWNSCAFSVAFIALWNDCVCLFYFTKYNEICFYNPEEKEKVLGK